MAKRLYKLETPGFNHIVPDTGEQLGRSLQKLAEETLAKGPLDDYYRRQAAHLFYLAADAWQSGADASIGHNRTARYGEQARKCVKAAEEL